MRAAEKNKKSILLLAMTVSIGVVFPLLQRIPCMAITGGDQSQYAKATIDLYRSWQDGPSVWWLTMVSSMRPKPPILPWISQFFLPFREVLGSTDKALLYGISLLSILALLGLFIAILQLSEYRIAPPYFAILLAATSPLFQYLFNEYLVESAQFLIVCWFILILVYSKSWDRSMLLAQLLLGGSAALLSKASTPSYVIFPGILASYFLLNRGDGERRWNIFIFKNWFSLACGLIVALATSAWYIKNYTVAKAHVIAASSGSVAAYWGKEDSYFNTMAYWLGAIHHSFFPDPVLWLYLLVLAAGAFGFVSKRRFKIAFFDLCVLVAIVQLLLLIILFSFSSNRESRYLLALLPYFALLGAWGLQHAANQKFHWGICLAISGLWLLSDGGRHNAGNDLAKCKVLGEIVQIAFPKILSVEKVNSIIAIDPGCRGDWLAPEPANYEAAKFALAHGIVNQMNFHYLGGGFFGSDWDAAWKHLLATHPMSIFVLSRDSPDLAKVRYNKGLQGENRQRFYHILEDRELFQEPKKMNSDGSVVVYYPTKEFEKLAGGSR